MKSTDTPKPLSMTRREVLAQSTRMVGGLIAAGNLIGLPLTENACAAQPIASAKVVCGLYERQDAGGARAAVGRACEHLDFSWLSPGDSVFIKVQSNSAQRHPAVTSPDALSGLVTELYRRGARRVLVGDQAGVEHVRYASGEARYGSTRALMKANGLLSAIYTSGAEPWLFDEHGFEDGYIEATQDLDRGNWKRPLFIAKIVDQVDHIVYLGRMSAHVLIGYSLGHDSAVGWMRDDSRFHLHHDAATLHEKLVEANYVREIRTRHRLTLTVADAYLLHKGPDEGTIAGANPLVVIGSASLANHDAVAAGILAHASAVTPAAPRLRLAHGHLSNLCNLVHLYSVGRITGIPWNYEPMAHCTPLMPHTFEQGIVSDRMLTRAYTLQGDVPKQIEVTFHGVPPRRDFLNALEVYSGARFTFAHIPSDLVVAGPHPVPYA